MHPAQIQAALKMAETPRTQAELARECDVSAVMIHDVIHGNRRSARIENRIAAITRLPLAALWPKWYGPNAPKRHRRALSAQRNASLSAHG